MHPQSCDGKSADWVTPLAGTESNLGRSTGDSVLHFLAYERRSWFRPRTAPGGENVALLQRAPPRGHSS